MTRQAINQQRYPSIPVPAHVKQAVKAWAKANKFQFYKIGDLIERLPEIAPYIKKGN